MRIVLNTEQSYKLSELAKATANDPSDLIYIVKQVDGKDVSFAVDRQQFIEGITGGGADSRFIISGGVVWSGTDNVFDVTAISYNFYGSTNTTAPTQITLDNGDSQPRFDSFVVDYPTNTVVVIQGTPAANPQIPQAGEDQVFITSVLIAAGASTPTITNDFVYRENVEWTTSEYTVGSPTPGTVDFESTDDPFEGTFCIRSNTSRSTGMRFQRTGSINLGNDTGEFSNLSFRIRFETPLPSNRKLLSSVWLSGSTVGQTANFSAFGINPNLVGEWQTIVIPTSVFNAQEIDRIQIRMDGGTNSEQVEYFLDYIVFSTGVAAPTQLPTITVQDEGTNVGTRPKLNFIEGTNVTFSIDDDPTNDRVNITINSTGGAGGSAEWGEISGTLADQTDLQNALNAKVDNSDFTILENEVDDLSTDLVQAETDIEDIQADYVKSTADFDTAGRVVIVDSAGRVVQQGSKLLADLRTETEIIDTRRSFSKPQWLDVATLTPVSDVFTPDLGASGSFKADLGADSTLANPTIPTGYDTNKVLAWDVTFTITGDGGWTLAFGNQYFVDADVDIATIISDNSTTGDTIQLFMQYKNDVISVQPFIPTAIV